MIDYYADLNVYLWFNCATLRFIMALELLYTKVFSKHKLIYYCNVFNISLLNGHCA